jgi:hypothetical protein
MFAKEILHHVPVQNLSKTDCNQITTAFLFEYKYMFIILDKNTIKYMYKEKNKDHPNKYHKIRFNGMRI